MSPSAEFRCDVPSADLLAALVAEPLPLGLVVRQTARHLYRDVYVDTSENALAVRGVALRLRYGADDRRTLTLGVAEAGAPVSGPSELYEAEVEGVGLAEILSGDSGPARRLRGLLDPARLEPRFELEIDRVVRAASRPWRLPGRFAFLYDRVTVRNGSLTREFQELKVRRLVRGRPRLEEVSRALEQAHGLRPLLPTKMVRARTLLRQLGRESLIRNLDSGRAVAVIALDEGRVAMLRDAAGLRLPSTAGAGEHAARHGLTEWFGTRVADLVLLGRTPPSIDQPSLEVWLARRLRRGLEPDGGRGIQWVPVADVAQSVRTSALRDAMTLGAFGVAARSALVPEWSSPRAAPADPAATPRGASAGATGVEFLDPRLSLLEFNARVLAAAEDARTPLLERLRYLAILSANLDEFFMAHGREAGVVRVEELLARQQLCIADCLGRLADQGHRLRTWASLSETDREALRLRFRREFFPTLTPRAITMSPGHPFPTIPALTLSLAVTLQGDQTGPLHFAYVRIASALPRFVEVAGSRDLVPIEEIVAANLGLLYPDRTVEEAAAFRITRKGDLELEDAAAGDLLQAVEEELDQRAVNPVVRLEIQQGASSQLREMLVQELRFDSGRGGGVGDFVIQEIPGLMAPADLRQLATLPVAGGAFPPFVGRSALDPDRPIWDQIRECDRLVHHPYDDFSTSVLRLLEDAASDPDVVAVKLTLYRTGEDSPVVRALVGAAEAGKEVAVFVELKASYDEARNIAWVKRLERAGAQVVYGLVGLKNHAKVALIVRREHGEIRRYAHIGTGNFNAGTARVYTDLGLLTADPEIGEDLGDLFNQLTGTSGAPGAALRHLLVAPEHLLPGLLTRIAREAEAARAGGRGVIRAKLNGLDDETVIRALYAASQAGVTIDLVVRGLCTLKPGVEGMSDRIRVRGLVGRFLEHARIFHFHNGGQDEYFIGSADWRSRNLRRRVEVAAPVRDPECRRRLDGILTREIADPSGWELAADGTYRQAHDVPIGDPTTSQTQAQRFSSGQQPAAEVVWTA
ncbi:MAG TPA: polyphosphate kinase 1 [Gemmatimonadales bacterium]|nr:polyphosphate kinase 1 [Gemmatimonadales bacterium]